MVNFIGYFYFTRIFMPLCLTDSYALHYSNYVSSMFKVGQGEWRLLSGHRWCVQLWISIPIQVSTDGWLVLSWLVSYSHHLLVYTTNVQNSSWSCKGASVVLQITGSNTVIFAVLTTFAPWKMQITHLYSLTPTTISYTQKLSPYLAHNQNVCNFGFLSNFWLPWQLAWCPWTFR